MGFTGFFRHFPVVGVLLLMACSLSQNIHSATPLFTKDTQVLGTWWWWVEPKDENKYLSFAAENGVNEIYYYTLEFNNHTGSFIQRAANKGIKVFLLVDNKDYIWNRDSFILLMSDFTAYQEKAGEKRKFAGIHLDIEPQDHSGFNDSTSTRFLQDYLDFVVWVCSTYRVGPDRPSGAETIDFDIAWWFDDKLSYKGGKLELYKALINEADRVFLMSYKDTAKETYRISKEEIAYAKSLNKQIILGAETGNVDYEPNISFYGRGKTYMYGQLHELHKLVDYDNYGLSIHYISAWYEMGK